MERVVTAKASDFATAILSLKGRNLSFENYKPWKLIYDISPRFMVLIAGRQIGKSVSLGGRSVTQAVAKKFFNSLYVAPFQIQAKRFSNAYLDPFMDSALIKKHYRVGGRVRNVYEKQFNTGSIIYLSYGQDEKDADRIRGIMADQLMIDEVQDVLDSALTPIFEVCSASPYGYKVLSGTAKSTSNILERMWQDTCKFEWVVKCHACGYWNIPDTFASCLAICELPHGPSCLRCRKVINMAEGQWVATRPSVKNRLGFHLPQFIMTANTKKEKWCDIYDKVVSMKNGGLYSPAKLSNEAFGISTDLAGKTLSVAEVMACCNEEQHTWYETVPERHYTHVVLGVDWSVTGSVISFTVVTVTGFLPNGKMDVIYSEKLQGIDILAQIDKVEAIFKKYNCDIIGSDRGVGVVQAQTLQRRLGFKKVVAINYVAAKVSVRYDKPGQFISADRTRALDAVVMKIRQGREKFETPSYQLTKSYWNDALEIFEEETSVGTRVYRHHPEKPDDWIHSIAFANVAYQYATGDFSFIDETGEGVETPIDAYTLPKVTSVKGYDDVD